MSNQPVTSAVGHTPIYIGIYAKNSSAAARAVVSCNSDYFKNNFVIGAKIFSGKKACVSNFVFARNIDQLVYGRTRSVSIDIGGIMSRSADVYVGMTACGEYSYGNQHSIYMLRMLYGNKFFLKRVKHAR